jgi:hypothetical protein
MVPAPHCTTRVVPTAAPRRTRAWRRALFVTALAALAAACGRAQDAPPPPPRAPAGGACSMRAPECDPSAASQDGGTRVDAARP